MKRLWIQYSCACLAFFYPLAWFAAALVLTLPRLLLVLLRGDKVRHIRPEYLGLSLAVQGDGGPGRAGAVDSFLILIAILLIAATPALLTRSIAGGLWIAILGNLGLLPAILPLVRGRVSGLPLGPFIVGLGLMAFGLHRMLKSEIATSYRSRIGLLIAAFVLPASAIPFLYFRGIPWTIGLIFWIPGLLISLVVSAIPTERMPVWRGGWIPALTGLVLSLALVISVQQGRAAQARQQKSAGAAAMAGVPPTSVTAPYPKLFFQRGVNFTSEGPDGYTPESSRPMLEALLARGVDAIALVPYAFTPKNSPQVRFGDGWETDEGIAQVAALAHHLKMKVLLKPQVWVGGGYPGDLEFRDPAAREKWFRQYQPYIEHHAELGKRIHADLFCVGVEFVKLSPYEDQWRNLIARVRQIYPGPLVYAATQGPEFEGIRFWDALDYIGLNNYYPLPDDLKTTDVVGRVASVQRRFRKPVIFTEVGFSAYENPHRQPWDETRRKVSPTDQARCYEAVFQAFYRQPWFMGMYWWKVGTNGHGGQEDGSFTPWRKPAMDVVARWYRHVPR